jgi:predicted outer membrane repeat protein
MKMMFFRMAAVSFFSILCGMFWGCSSGTTCSFEGQTFCSEDRVYDVDSCGNILEEKNSCQCGCNDDHTDCASCGCSDTCPALGDSQCVGGQIRQCETGADGCRQWSEYTACPEGECLNSTTCGSCDDECPGLNVSVCSNGQIRTCQHDNDGCLEWSPYTDCPDGFCADATSCGTCDNQCEPEFATQCSNGQFRSCVADQRGCLDWSGYTACPEGFCDDEFVCGGCTNQCSSGESECVLASGMIRHCEQDQHGCLVWSGYAACEDGFCENETTCGTCDNACSPEGAISCANGDYRTCITDDDGCLIWGPDQVCDQGACASTELCLECFDLDEDGHNAVAAACPAADDNCDDDPGNWTTSGCANCVDNDGDLYGTDCDIGPDWDDEDDSVWGPFPFCGDGDVDPGEACDDGDNDDNDGCSGECDVESGYICQGQPSDCIYEDAVVIYVDDDAPAGGDGTRWSRAINRLSLGLTAAVNALDTYSRVEIWVGQGTYYPYPEQRATAFDLMDNLSLYGGFDGNLHHSLSQRDWEQYPTILSGDIGTRGLQDDNVYHVLRANGISGNCILDGFTIRDGYAEENNDELGLSGAGLLSEDSQLTLRDCTFTSNQAGLSGGGAHIINGYLSMTNCTFTGNAGEGGGLSNLNGAVNLTNCTFSNNHSDTNGGAASNINGGLNMTDCSFTDNDSDDNGGGIYTTSGNLNLTNCSFLRNETNSYGSFGGGVYSNNSYIDLVECTFTSNETRGRGAGIYAENGTVDISNCQFNSNEISCWSDDFCSGAGICRLDGSLVVSDSSLHGNQITRGSSTTKWGGGLYIENGTAELHSTDFQANHMLVTLPSGNQEYTGKGGGIYAAANSEISLFECTFTNNNAVDGGGIYLFVDANLEAHDCTFTGNRADPDDFDGRGGAIHQYWGSQFIADCIFENNSSTATGGAVYITHGSSTHLRNKFIANHSSLRGGAIYAWQIPADYSGPELINCLFSGNSAASSRGGAIYFSETIPSLANCLFSSNSTSVSGGGVYLTESDATLVNCTFSRNTADIGCGLFADNSTATIENSIFWNASDGLQISGTVAEDISVTYSCVDGGYTGEGNVDFCEPAFSDEDGQDDISGTIDDDLSLLPASDCIDVGNNSALPVDLHDVDQNNNNTEILPIDLGGDTRVVNSTVDIGAYEAQ